MAAQMNGNAAQTKIDNARERELYRYFQPPAPSSETLIAHQASSPDTTLTALAQLCALRLHSKRAMISVIGRDKQYFIAESTKTLDLADDTKSEVEGDGLWFGCGTVDKAGRLCEKTIELPPSLGLHPSLFTVTDLSKDERFNELPFVTGPPFFKFYAGTPLTTKKGINIGSLFIIDNEVREPLNTNQELFLGTVASTVMKHMETTSEAVERKKVTRLSLGMNAFVEGKSRININGMGQDHIPGLAKTVSSPEKPPRKKGSQTGSRSLRGSTSRNPLPVARLRSDDNTGSPSDADTSQDDSDSSRATKAYDTGHRATFARAANILCESLDLKDRGGVVFFDATSRRRTEYNAGPNEQQVQKPAEIISYSTLESDFGTADQARTTSLNSFAPVEEGLLHNLLSRYPRGKLWTFDRGKRTDGNLSSSEEEILSPRQDSKTSDTDIQNRINRKYHEASLLQHYFPGARQLMFSGLWDAGSSRWFAGGFIWTTSIFQIFTRETELSYFLAFKNNVMAEVSRLASIASDRQKADFIGSISHEFRSPLHGILASAEFLAEIDADAFQSNLVDTISSCGRTLLDTINHILDYSKINSFERNWRNVRKPGSRFKQPMNRRVEDKDAPPMMNIYSTIDVAAITEEVVEGVYAGQIYQDISSTDAPMFSAAPTTEANDTNDGIRTRKKLGKAIDVDVIIDIPHDNYIFTTQPGALKRVIMNIFGNALKYTQKGSIVVKLSLDPSDVTQEPLAEERVLEIKVTDTGKGISSEYLRTSLFNPFCQEDVLASGTGLGLSIVKSIVTMLRGTIDVKSEVEKGTEVTVRVPLARLPGTATSTSTPSSTLTGSSGESMDESMNVLHTEYQDSIVGLHAFKNPQAEIVLKEYIEAWCGLKIAQSSVDYAMMDVVILDERHLPQLAKESHSNPPTIVLCSNASRTHAATRHHTPRIIEFVSKPLGPHKLAKALRFCLERAKNCKLGLTPIIAFPGEGSAKESEASTAIPELERLTLGSATGDHLLEVQTNGIVTARSSDNAHMAIDQSSSNATSGDVTVTGNDSFPFPPHEDSESQKSETRDHEDQRQFQRTRDRADLVRRDSRRPALVSRVTEPVRKVPFSHTSQVINHYNEAGTFPVEPPNEFGTAQRDLPKATVGASRLTAANIALHNGNTPTQESVSQPKEQEKRSPRLLLVDDNKINLRLLETYLRKRKYKYVDSAENGQLAVQAAEAHEHGYDIIFMDISMPIMNGFEATRAIREIEDARIHNREEDQKPTPAFIIALTGLASSRDQTEAFTSGVDLFMTKPVSFKEVGKLLDNWEAHGGMKPAKENDAPKA